MAAATNEGIAQTGIGVSSIETRCAELSGGQRQALAIVRARMRGRKVVLFDEPTSALGIEEQERVNALLRSLADRGMAVLLISHNLPKAHEICDRIAVLKMGRLVAEVEPSTCSLDELVQHVVG
jgi:ABC-type sugar transport system ATPase subunit